MRFWTVMSISVTCTLAWRYTSGGGTVTETLDGVEEVEYTVEEESPVEDSE